MSPSDNLLVDFLKNFCYNIYRKKEREEKTKKFFLSGIKKIIDFLKKFCYNNYRKRKKRKNKK